jgi:protein-S-isoprenylcysteine O-methyltransferase Ste14
MCDRTSPNYINGQWAAVKRPVKRSLLYSPAGMPPVRPGQPLERQQDPDWWVRAGGWLFTWRTALPIPIALALLLVPSRRPSVPVASAGFILVVGGELLRLWAVRQIGTVSRTRSERLGPLVSTGPFAFVRNPLYLGNIALWAGFCLCAGLFRLGPVVIVVLGLVYHAIVRWEERLLESRLADGYREYAARVPRWLPKLGSPSATFIEFSWRETLFSERGTLIAIAVGFTLLYLKFLLTDRS